MNISLSQINQLRNEALGRFTKSHSTPENKGFERVHDFILQDQSAKLLPRERVRFCLKNRIDKYKKREVKYNEDRKKAHWSNVQRCGSIWTCPVCAKQVTEKRKEELKLAVKNWKDKHNGTLMLLTLTNRHSASHLLKYLIEGQKKALKYFFGDRKGVLLFKLLGRQFHVRSFEVTYGENGWHPHFHILLFLNGQSIQNYYKVLSDLKQHWLNCCLKAKLPAPNLNNGLDLRDGDEADDYIAKWGTQDQKKFENNKWTVASELTKGHIKKGKKESLSPFDLLNFSIEDKEVFSKLPSKLFQEFAISFKGARQLVWSRGLKKLLGIDEKSDEELAEETENNSILLEEVPDLIFSLLCKYQKRHSYLEALENDYENGLFGSQNSEASLLIQFIVDKEIKFLESNF